MLTRPIDSSIGARIDSLLPGYRNLAVELVQLASVHDSENAIQLRVKQEMMRIGLFPEMISCGSDGGGPNLAVRIPGSDPDLYRSLILNTHADIAPVDETAHWEHPPFSGIVESGVLFGRGAQDDKSGIAILLLVAEALIGDGRRLAGDLVLHVVVDEETTGNGTRAVVGAGYTGDGALIIDGTWPERIIHGHLGQVSAVVRVAGDATAAPNATRNTHPVNIAMRFIQAAENWIDMRNSSSIPFMDIEHPYFINVGAFHAGVWCGSVPAEARLEIQMGFPAGECADSMLAGLRDVARRTSERIKVEAWLLNREPFQGDPDIELIRRLSQVIRSHGGADVLVRAVKGYTDMPSIGTRQVCLYGPGGGRNAHGANECYFLDHMQPVATNIAVFADEWCSTLRD